MIFKSHEYQNISTTHLIDNPFAGLFLDMGLGKTVSTLTAIKQLLGKGKIRKTLVIAPKRVAKDTWSDELAKWDHLKGLTMSKILGTSKQRLLAIHVKADIYVINREMVVWLVTLLQERWPFDMVVIDELSSFKSAGSNRFKALRRVRPLIKRCVGLTGTPMPNGLIDLWPQMYLLDMGERLGPTLGGFRDKYFRPAKQQGHIVYTYALKGKAKDDYPDLFGPEQYEAEIYEKISDICISMKAKDWLDLPPMLNITTTVHLDSTLMKRYNDFERDQVMQLANAEGTEISAPSATAVINKLLQFSNGAVYDGNKDWHEIHNEKIEALGERLEAAQGKPTLVLYQFKHDVERIKQHLKEFNPVHMDDVKDVVKAWNNFEIQTLLGHPASMGHGLNMQDSGDLIEHFGLPWSSELYSQAITRIHRQGKTRPVTNDRLLCKGTYDEVVLERVEAKLAGQDRLMSAVDAVKVLMRKHNVQ